MKDVCICIDKSTDEIISIGIREKYGQYYYSEEYGGGLKVGHKPNLFEYKEFTFEEFREVVQNGLKKPTP